MFLDYFYVYFIQSISRKANLNMYNLPKPTALLFDWDNTLVNTWPVIHNALVHTFESMGQQPWSFEQTKDRVRKSMRDSFPEIFGENWQSAGKIYQSKYQETHLDTLEPMAGATELLDALKESGVFVGIVSNKTSINLRKELNMLNWNHYFRSIVGSTDAVRDKPHADPVHLALKDSGITPNHNVWFIGDSEIDIECAHNLALTGILVGDREIDPASGWKFTHMNELADLQRQFISA